MKTLLLSFFCILALSFGTFTFVQAAEPLRYTPLVTDLPFMDLSEAPTTEGYVNALYLLSITVAALLAVIKIIFGGVKWMLSDVVTDKSSAKKDIKGALLGLLIVLAAVLILNTINEDLTTLNIFGDAPDIGSINQSQGGSQQNNNNPVMNTTMSGGTPAEYTRFNARCRSEGGSVISIPPSTIKCLPQY